MFEMNPDGPSRPSPSPDISFEMPAHEMCVERQAVLRRLDGQSEYVTFGIDFMPDKIHVNGRKFVYEGVADGRGFYREDSKDNRERQSSELLEPVRQMAQGFISAALAVQETDKAYKSREELSVCSAENGCGNRQISAEDTGADNRGFFHAANYSTGQVLLILKNSGIDTDCGACMAQAFTGSAFAAEHTCQGAESRTVQVEFEPLQSQCSPDDGCGLQADSHTTASPCDNMPCFRCSEVLDLVSQMIENPPGLSGIKCHLGHVGNHYIDAGWVEALNRVKALLVTGGSGTRETL